VEKVELAVMAELMLRGAQTEGELRGRASRMEPIADLNVLRSILDSLRAKRLVLDLTPPGRGQIISHALYELDELERLKEKCSAVSGNFEGSTAATSREASHGATATTDRAHRLEDDLRSLREEVAELRHELQSLTEIQRQQAVAISDLRTSLGG
jgi:hypothetical protein